MKSIRLVIVGIASAWIATAAHAEPAPFDLVGPELAARVTRGTKTLPLSQVPSLAQGDRLWIKAELPATQSVPYLLVAAFLRGATNPPPEDWFFRCSTAKRSACARNGLEVVVPEGARQVLVFLAPVTGGDFRTLMDAVSGRPGAFVRASQDLNQATLDRSRLESYLASIRSLNTVSPQRIKDTVPLLARSLAISVDQKCFDKIPDLQLPCLIQGRESLILNDGHSASIVETLTSGPVRDLAMQASFTPQLNYGYYSPYIASVLDIGRILSSFHTARFQYIPALAAQYRDRLALMLNTPPSFQNPKSVLVSALPSVEQNQPPPIRPVDPDAVLCARKTPLVLPVEGAPLVFSTAYAHDMKLRFTDAAGNSLDVPARADAQQGGYVVDTSELRSIAFGERMRGTLHGQWGFEPYEGPSFELVNARPQVWKTLATESDSLIVGREGKVNLQAPSVGCVSDIFLRGPGEEDIKAEWKIVAPDQIEIKLPLKEAQPGLLTVAIHQYGLAQAQSVPLHAFAELARVEKFTIHAGDRSGVLRGSRLDEVARLSMEGIEFAPASLSTASAGDELVMSMQDPAGAGSLTQGKRPKAQVTLADGRVLKVSAFVDTPRPSARLIGKNVLPSPAVARSNIELANSDELPHEATLTFSLRSQSPGSFSREETVEVATGDESVKTTLTFANGGLTLVDRNVAVATMDPSKAFGPSAFGPLRFRVVSSGVAGEWQPLAVLVRLPVLEALECPANPEFACKLSGSRLFLIHSLSIDPQFERPVQVPEGFTGGALPIPHPSEGRIYVKLRDNPSTVDTASLRPQTASVGAEAGDANAEADGARPES